MTREFRFGATLAATTDRAEWVAKCRRVEELGYDVLLVPDHLDMSAPFPAVMLAAQVTARPRIGTFVLNAGFYVPTVLARDAVATDRYTGGRLELGLGAGYVQEEFERAGLEFPSPGERVDHLERTVAEITALGDARPPLLIGGNGDRVLRLAAATADIVAFAGLKAVPGDPPLTAVAADEMDERVALVRAAAGGRDYESNLLLQAVVPTDDRHGRVPAFQRYAPMLTVHDLLELPALLIGTPEEMAERLHANRERYGFSYISVLEPSMEDFVPVMALLRSTS